MKPLTFYTTLAAIVVGTGMVCNALFIIFVGLILGPIFLSPLFVTLCLSRYLSGTAIQLILLFSTLLYPRAPADRHGGRAYPVLPRLFCHACR